MTLARTFFGQRVDQQLLLGADAAAGQDAAAHAGAQRNADHIGIAFGCTGPDFAQQHAVGIVGNGDGQAKLAFQRAFDVHADPAGKVAAGAGHQRQQGAVRLQFLFNSAGHHPTGEKKPLRTECWRDNAHPDVLVIVPPSITPEYDKLKFREEMGPGCHEQCAGIAAQLEPMLKDLPGVRFLDANLLPGAGCSPVDGMHLTPEAHKAVAESLKNALTSVTLL